MSLGDEGRADPTQGLAEEAFRTALDDLIVKQAPQQQEPEPRSQDVRRGAKVGRPRLDCPRRLHGMILPAFATP